MLLGLLSADLKKEYQRLQPLAKYRENGIPKFSLLKGQSWVFNRALELGWDKSLHEDIERSRLGHSHGKHDHHIERIGKKYQHIAFAELVGYLADYHWYLDWDSEPRILSQLEEFDRADIDATYLSGCFSKPVQRFLPDNLSVPQLAFFPESAESNIAWTRTLRDIPDLKKYLIQSDTQGYHWCLQHYFCRSHDYMKGFNSSDPFKSAQVSIELILVDQAEISHLRSLATRKISENNHDIFESGWSSYELFGQRSFRHLNNAPTFKLSKRAVGFNFGRITQNYSPKYNDYDRSGVSEEMDFYAPHQALISELKLRPKDGWSSLFVTEDGSPAFSHTPASLGGIAVIRRDVIEKFANAHNLKIVWRVWVEKDGGLGTNHSSRWKEQFSRRDFIGFFFDEVGGWQGELIPFRD